MIAAASPDLTKPPKPILRSKPRLAIALILLAGLGTSSGQLFWKISAAHPAYLFVGFALYGAGAVLMITSFRFSEVSVLHPMLSASYIFCLILGHFVLKEHLHMMKIGGILLIALGLISLGISSSRNRVKG